MKIAPLKLCLSLIFVSVSFCAPAQNLKKKVGKFVLINAGEKLHLDSANPAYSYYIFETEVTNQD